MRFVPGLIVRDGYFLGHWNLHGRPLIHLSHRVLLNMSTACVQGNVIVVGRKSPYSLYDEKIASFEDDGGLYDQKDAAGFIKLQARPCCLTICHTLLPRREQIFASGADFRLLIHCSSDSGAALVG